MCICLRGCTRLIDSEYSWTGPYCNACTSDGKNCECGEYNDDTPVCCLLPEGSPPTSVPPSPPGSDAGSDDDLRRSTGFGGFSGMCCPCCPAPFSLFLTSFLFLSSYQGVWGLCCWGLLGPLLLALLLRLLSSTTVLMGPSMRCLLLWSLLLRLLARRFTTRHTRM